MKKTLLITASLLFCMATFAKAQQAKSIKPTEATPKVYTFHGCRIDMAKDSVGKSVSIAGIIKSSQKQGNTVLVKMGAAYTDKLLTIILKGRAATMAVDIDGKHASAYGVLTEKNGEPVLMIDQPSFFQVIRNRKFKD